MNRIQELSKQYTAATLRPLPAARPARSRPRRKGEEHPEAYRQLAPPRR
jgi:hypothetical protein